MDVRIITTQPTEATDADDEPMQCACGHTFEREDLDYSEYYILLRENVPEEGIKGGYEEEPDVSDYTTTMEEHECPHCGDCRIENERITLAPVITYLCTNCMMTYGDEDDAESCCEEDD